jgi:ankyrin repeat protein
MEAVWYGHIEATSTLLEMGADPNLIEKDWSSCLHEAAYGGSYGYEIEKLRRKKRQSTTLSPTDLTRNESDITSFDQGDSDEASRRLQILQMLLDSGQCQIDMIESHGCTPLWYAAAQGWTRGTQLLLNAGACLNTKHHLPSEHCNEYSPLGIALRHCHFETVRHLLNRGAHLSVDEYEYLQSSKQLVVPKDLWIEITNTVQESCVSITNKSVDFQQGTPCHAVPKRCFAHG